MNLGGIVEGGMVNEADREQELALKNKALGIDQFNADTSRMGEQNRAALTLQQQALERASATIQQAQQIKAALAGPNDVAGVQGTLGALRQEFIALSAGAGMNPQTAGMRFDSAISTTPTRAESNQFAASKVAAEEAAKAANAPPTVGHYQDTAGNEHITLTKSNGSVQTVNLGGARNPLDVGRFRADLALRSRGQNVQNPEIQKLSPQDALAVSSTFGQSDPMKAAIGNLIGGSLGAPAGVDTVAIANRILQSGSIDETEWNQLSKSDQAAVAALVKQGRAGQPAPPAATPSAPIAGGARSITAPTAPPITAGPPQTLGTPVFGGG